MNIGLQRKRGVCANQKAGEIFRIVFFLKSHAFSHYFHVLNFTECSQIYRQRILTGCMKENTFNLNNAWVTLYFTMYNEVVYGAI